MISIVLHLYLKVIFEKKNTFRPIYFEICYVYNKSYAIPYSIKLQAHACSESNPLPFQWRSFRYRDMDSHLSNMVRGCMQIFIFWLYFQFCFFLIWNMWVLFFLHSLSTALARWILTKYMCRLHCRTCIYK